MPRKPFLALGLAVTLCAGTAPALAAGAAPDTGGTLLDAVTAAPRVQGVSRTGAGATKSLTDSTTSLPVDNYVRIGGATRYETAVNVSRAMVCDPDTPAADCHGLGGAENPVSVVFVANGVDFPDALGAGPVASGLGPLLLVPGTGTVPAVVMDEIKRIAPEAIVIFGGTGAVSSGVASQLAAYGTVSRIAGANRYETAAAAASFNDDVWRQQDEDGDGLPDDKGLDTVVLASGQGFADSLSGGGAAANSRGSLMLTANTTLPGATKAVLQEIQPATVVIAGGTDVVSSAVESAVVAALPGTTVLRAAGADRFGTSIALSERVFAGGTDEVFLVNGYNFPDALASAPLAGVWGASTLLAKKACVTSGTAAEATRLDPLQVTGFGGEGVLTDDALFLTVC